MGIEAAARKDEARALFAPLPRHYDLAAALTSFGQDPRWRRAMVRAVGAQQGQRVLDVATGTGLVAAALVRRFRCTVVGVDQSPQMLGRAEAKLREDPMLQRAVTLVRAEAERLPFAGESFDHVTFTYLLRYVEDPAATLSELTRVLKRGGTLACLEFGLPRSQPWRALWHAYTKVGLPAVLRLVSKEWAQTGAFLARSIPSFYARHPLDEQLEMWHAAGMREVRVRRMSLGAGVVMWGQKEGTGPAATAGGARAEMRDLRRGAGEPPSVGGESLPEEQDGCAEAP